ncbi:hypothetical protein HF072_01165 [Bacillus sp. RO3]|nr:hypothetical protein [Bacillus sp. RO3]
MNGAGEAALVMEWRKLLHGTEVIVSVLSFIASLFPSMRILNKKIEESLTPIKGYSHLITESNQQR